MDCHEVARFAATEGGRRARLFGSNWRSLANWIECFMIIASEQPVK